MGIGDPAAAVRGGESAESLGLTGREVYDIEGLATVLAEGYAGPKEVTVRARKEDGSTLEFRAVVRIDTPQEAAYYRHGGILRTCSGSSWGARGARERDRSILIAAVGRT